MTKQAANLPLLRKVPSYSMRSLFPLMVSVTIRLTELPRLLKNNLKKLALPWISMIRRTPMSSGISLIPVSKSCGPQLGAPRLILICIRSITAPISSARAVRIVTITISQTQSSISGYLMPEAVPTQLSASKFTRPASIGLSIGQSRFPTIRGKMALSSARSVSKLILCPRT